MGYYTQLATEAGLIGIAFNATPSLVVPPGGTTSLIGTNPFSISIPRPAKAPLIFDIATSAISFSQLQIAQRDHTPLPAGVAVDREGVPTIDPFEAVDDAHRGRLLPFAGYKGFGLALMIELLFDTPPANAGEDSEEINLAEAEGLTDEQIRERFGLFHLEHEPFRQIVQSGERNSLLP